MQEFISSLICLVYTFSADNHINARVVYLTIFSEMLLHLLDKMNGKIFRRTISLDLQIDWDSIFYFELEVKIIGVIVNFADCTEIVEIFKIRFPV